MSKGEPRWLTAEEQAVWRSWLKATALMANRINDQLRQHGLDNGEYEVLVALSEAPGQRLRMSELADQANQSRSRLTHTVGRMEKDGLIERMPSAGDRRGIDAVLTPLGLSKIVKLAPKHVEAVRGWTVDAMSHEEFLALGVALERMIAAPDDVA